MTLAQIHESGRRGSLDRQYAERLAMRVVHEEARWALAVIVLAGLGLIGFMAFVRRDHKVELIVTYPKSPPAAVWRLLTDHAAEPKWLPAPQIEVLRSW